jgi:flagellar motor component MotA
MSSPVNQLQTQTPDQLAATLVTETYKLIDAQGNALSGKIAVMFLARFTGMLIYRSLAAPAPDSCKTKEEKYNFTSQNFAKVKQATQEAIAAAFSGAMHTFVGKPMEYYCLIKPVGPAVNKEPC